MIEITQDKDAIILTGHAGAPPDLVCEDITALLQCLLFSLDKLTEDVIEYRVKKGHAFLRYDEDLSADARLLIESFFVGCEAVADAFPEKVRVSRPARH